LHSILIVFVIRTKSVRLIKIWVNQSYSKVRIDKYLSDVGISCSEWSETRRCSIASASLCCFKICH